MEYALIAALAALLLIYPLLKKVDLVMVFLAAILGRFIFDSFFINVVSQLRESAGVYSTTSNATVGSLLVVLPVVLAVILTTRKSEALPKLLLGLLTVPASFFIMYDSLSRTLATTDYLSGDRIIPDYYSQFFNLSMIVALVAVVLTLVLSKPKKPKD